MTKTAKTAAPARKVVKAKAAKTHSVKKMHPADAADAAAIAQAVEFHTHLRKGPHNVENKAHKSLVRAVLYADKLREDNKGRDVLIYAVTAPGQTVHVPKAMQEQARVEAQKVAEKPETKQPASPAQIKAAARKALDALIEERAPMKALVAAVHKAGIPSDHAPAFVRQHLEARKAHVEDKPQPTRGDEQLAFAKAKAREKLDELVGKKAPVDQMVRAAQRAGIPTERAPGFVNQHLAAYIKGHDGKIPNAVLQSADKTALRAIAEAATHGKDAVKAEELPRLLRSKPEPEAQEKAEKQPRKAAAKKARTAAPDGEWRPAYQPDVAEDKIKAPEKGSRAALLIKALSVKDGITDADLSEKVGVKHAISAACAAAARAGLKVQRRRADGKVVYRIQP